MEVVQSSYDSLKGLSVGPVLVWTVVEHVVDLLDGLETFLQLSVLHPRHFPSPPPTR